MIYCQIDADKNVIQTPRSLPKIYNNISNFNLLDDVTLKSYGWIPVIRSAIESYQMYGPLTVYEDYAEYAIENNDINILKTQVVAQIENARSAALDSLNISTGVSGIYDLNKKAADLCLANQGDIELWTGLTATQYLTDLATEWGYDVTTFATWVVNEYNTGLEKARQIENKYAIRKTQALNETDVTIILSYINTYQNDLNTILS